MNKNPRIKLKLCLVLSLFSIICLLTGCHASTDKEKVSDESISGTQSIEEEEEEEEIVFDRTGHTWDNTEWKEAIASKKNCQMYIDSFTHVKVNDITDYNKTRMIRDDWAYVLYYINGVKTGYLNSVKIGEEHPRETDFDMSGIFEDEQDTILNCSLCGSQEFAFLIGAFDEEKMTKLKVVFTNEAGQVQKELDLLSVYDMSGIYSVDRLDKFGKIDVSMSVDGDGRIYLYVSGNSPILVLENDGSMACVMDIMNGQQSAEEYISVDRFCSPDDKIIFYINGNGWEKSVWFTYDAETNCERILMDKKRTHMIGALFTEDGYCYYFNQLYNNFCRWDLFTGKTDTFLNVSDEAIAENMNFVNVYVDDNKQIYLYHWVDDGIEIYSLTQEKPSEENFLKVVSFTSDCSVLQAAAADYTRKNQKNGIFIETPKGDTEAFRTRTMADILSGKGPEVMFVSRKDMEELYEKGALEDLTDYLSEETKQNIFSGVLDSGKIDNRQIGYPVTGHMLGMAVKKGTFSQDTWNIENILSMIREGRFPNLESILYINGEAGLKCGYGASSVLTALIFQDLNNTPFLNLEEGICNFDSSEFVELLKLCKKYQVTLAYNSETVYQKSLEEKVLAYVGDLTEIHVFCGEMGDLQDAFTYIGFPVDNGPGMYWDCDYYLVMRKGTGRKQYLQGLLEFVYSLNRQCKQRAVISSEVLEKRIVDKGAKYDAVTDTYYIDGIYKGESSFIPLRAKPDGGSWTSEFLEIGNKSIPKPHDADEIVNIVREEVSAFFDGDKDAETVAKIIQSRAKLFIMENQK